MVSNGQLDFTLKVMNRKLSIKFCEDFSVEYHFSRIGKPLASYVVEYPAHLIEILSADKGYTISTTLEGWLRLDWVENLNNGWSSVHYKKLGMLEDSGSVFSYKEIIKVNGPYFGLWLGSPQGVFSALKQHSSAVFTTTTGVTRDFKPRELSEHVFSGSGVLKINWQLESKKYERR